MLLKLVRVHAAHLLETRDAQFDSIACVLSVVYATKAITKIIYDRVLSVVYATKAINQDHYDLVLSVVWTAATAKIIDPIASG